jgi:hypothetical protein
VPGQVKTEDKGGRAADASRLFLYTCIFLLDFSMFRLEKYEYTLYNRISVWHDKAEK